MLAASCASSFSLRTKIWKAAACRSGARTPRVGLFRPGQRLPWTFRASRRYKWWPDQAGRLKPSPGMEYPMTRILPLLVATTLFATGCNDSQTPQPVATTTTTGGDAKIQAALAKLAPEDRTLAEQQKYCANEPENRLGSMGAPVKVMVNGEAVFVCCAGCKDDVLKDPDKTLKTVAELKAKAKTEK